MTRDQRKQAEALLELAKEAQTTYWEIIGKLEELTSLEIDSTQDLQGWTIASLLESANADDTDEDEQEIPVCTACGCDDGTCQHAS